MKNIISIIFLLGLYTGNGFSQTIKYVKPIAAGTGDGSNWANASGNLKAIIDGAASNTQVWVAAGTYRPTTTTSRTVSFVMKNGVSIYGGFFGNETLLSQRNLLLNTSILSGDIGVTGNMADNSYHVVYNSANALDITAILDGFTITAGNSNGNGGGIYNDASGPLIANCIISGNQAADGGGGAYNVNAKAFYTNCSFMGNLATNNGGAMLNYKCTSPPSLINCTFSGNQATSGGAVYSYLTNTILTNGISWGNSSGIVDDGSTSQVTYSLVQGGFTGTGNLSADPKFIAQPALGLGSKGNLRLQPCSPAINVGSNGANSTTTDLVSNARKTGTIDMGAYERPAAAVAGVLFVNDNGPHDGGDGSNWTNALVSLQDALTVSSCPGITQLWVAGGIYKPTTGTDRSISFSMKNNLAIYGGFAGTETLLSQRNWKTNETILSGDIGVAGVNSDNSAPVISNVDNGLNNTAILDGFTVAFGSTAGTGSGGVYNEGSSPVMANCTFMSNIGFKGGAVYNNSSAAAFYNCVFKGNIAQYGAAMLNEISNTVVSNCIFYGNQVGESGGAIQNVSCSPTITNCSFSGNQATSGGGIFSTGNPFTTTVTNCIFYGNSAPTITNENSAQTVVTYSIVQGGYPGIGNLDKDPQFVSQPPVGLGTTGNLHLQTCSPAQDAGSDAANALTTDLDGNPRKFNGKAGANNIDMGAYEIQVVCCPPANIFYVKANATGNNSGTSWANAFTSLQDALAQTALCANVTQVWVAAGTYKPTTGTDRTISFVMKNNLAIYGGFAGTETLLSQRNWNINPSILSGDIGAVGDSTDNSHHVIANAGNGVNATAVLDGFRITGGNANSVSTYGIGGGMYNSSVSPTITHCSFTGNTAKGGSAIYNESSSPTITTCSFTGNTGIDGSTSTIVCVSASTPVFSNCDFIGNTGGGLYFTVSSPTITSCRFLGNNAKLFGGGINNSGGTATVTNCVFIGNQAGTSGGGLLNGGTLSLVNCSFSGNNAGTGGAIFNVNNQSLTVVNSIVYGNSSEIVNESTAATVTYSIVKGGYAGTGNLDIDPQFLLQPAIGLGTAGNLHLQTCSPAQDAGSDAANALTTDLDGNPRKFNGKAGANNIDMGAYEIQAACCPPASIFYVNDDAAGANNGSSWANAFTSLQDALAQTALCGSVTQVWVAAGTYKPTTGTDRTISFKMKNNLALYGGFAGNETELNQRNWTTNESILSGDIGAAGDNADNSYHVVMNNFAMSPPLDASSILDGFTITGGNANGGTNETSGGGGICNMWCHPAIANCHFSGNNASEQGGAVYNNYANPSFFNCSFSGNQANAGGAMYNYQSSSFAITNCSFSENLANDLGGAMVNASSSFPTITHCSFTSNYATGAGGAIHNYSLCSPVITDCRFMGNSVWPDGGTGGAIYNELNAAPPITNCSFIGNQALLGGAIFNHESAPEIVNCSFSGNLAKTSGGGIYNTSPGSTPSISNCILYGNSSEIAIDAGANPTIIYSIVKGGYAGTGNLDVDPQFVLQPPIGPGTTGDLRLKPCSPAINIGSDAANSTTVDLDNNSRKFGTIDMGAYERQSAKPIVWYLDKNATGNGDGTSWANAFTNMATALAQLKTCNTTDTLKIAAGTYSSSVPPYGPFEFDKLQGVILGGYPTGGGERNPEVNLTIIWNTVNVRQSMRIDGIRMYGD